jgi:S1-C subfamily serine protease
MHSLLNAELAKTRAEDTRRRLERPRGVSLHRAHNWPAVALASVLFALVVLGSGCGADPAPPVQAATPIPTPVKLTPKQVQQKVRDQIVRIRVRTALIDEPAGGTGIYVGDGQVVTAAHVVDGVSVLKVQFHHQTTGATVKAISQAEDLAVLSLNTVPSGLVPAQLGDSGAVSEGDTCYQLGFPVSGLSRSGQSQQLRMTMGLIGAKGLQSTVAPDLPSYSHLLSCSGVIQPGNSGGPTLDENGDVIGMAVVGNSSTSENYSIEINHIKPLLPPLQAGTSPPSLGMSFLVFSRSDMRTYLGVNWNAKTTLVVSYVKPGSPADKAGVEVGDIVVIANGHRTRTIPQIYDVTESQSRGDTVKLEGLFAHGNHYEKRVKLK